MRAIVRLAAQKPEMVASGLWATLARRLALETGIAWRIADQRLFTVRL